MVESRSGGLGYLNALTARRAFQLLLPLRPAQYASAPVKLRNSTGNKVRISGGKIVTRYIRPQAFRVLELLVRSACRFISFAEMIQGAWGGTAVGRHTVAVTVSEVKKALQEYGSWVIYQPRVGYQLRIPGNEDLIKRGWHYWHRRTREGFEKALSCFQKAAIDDSADFQAFAGLGLSYLMLGTYGIRSPREMYAGFLNAHNRSVELTDWTPELRTDHGHGLHIFERRLAEAEQELFEARTDKPELVTVHVSLSMLYAGTGRFGDALGALADAYRADALWPTLPALETFVFFCARNFSSAMTSGRKAVDLHPYVHLGRCYYAQALDYAGDVAEALTQYHLASVMAPDIPWLRALHGFCLARHGRFEEGSAILDELERVRRNEYVDAYYMAVLLDALGKREGAVRELDRAVDEDSATLFILDVDPKMDPLRNDPRVERIRDKLFGKR